ncbi:hypothetical protein QQ39_03735 [Pragia fontium]|nr:hypothetical protein QQ39_03735 [Pragia fontium]
MWGLGLCIGLMCIRPAAAIYNVTATTAISQVTISGKATADTGLITTFVISSATVSGEVYCGDRNEPPNTAYQYTLIDLPRDTDNYSRYRINDNLSLSATAANGSLGTWVSNQYSAVCSNSNSAKFEPASKLANAYPITLSFYVKHRPIDNLITFPAMPLGGYIRSFGGARGVTDKVYAIPIVLMGGTIQLPSTCTVNPTALVLNHGTVPVGLASHRVSVPITYTCDSSVRATFKLSYDADGNGALPLKDSAGRTGAVSKLTITDPQTGTSGRTIKAAIQKEKTFTVSSELSQITGSGAVSGSAWLIATHD